MRNVTGTVPTADKISSVVAVQVGNSTTYTAPVDASGHFSITLPIGQRFYLTFVSTNQTVGALRYTSSSGAFMSDLNITHAPKSQPSLSPASEGADDDAEVDDDSDSDSDDDGIEDQEIELGDVDNPAGDDKYVPSQNPEQQCDSDGDGEDDFGDGDDNGEHEDGADDSDSDGLPDVVDTDDDGDGVPDAAEV